MIFVISYIMPITPVTAHICKLSNSGHSAITQLLIGFSLWWMRSSLAVVTRKQALKNQLFA